MFIIPKMIGIGEIQLGIEILKKLDTVDFQYAFQREHSSARFHQGRVPSPSPPLYLEE